MKAPAATRDVVTFPGRFNGPPGSGNGGYVSGRMARYIAGPASVRLRVPPPLDRGLKVEATDEEALLFDGETLVAQAQRSHFELSPPAPPTFADAEAASKAHAAFARHPLPHCFVCGLARAEGDGLRIFPGPTQDEGVLAAPWVPHSSLDDGTGRVAPEFLWSALDCAGAFAVMEDMAQPIILGELSARLDRELAIGEPVVVVAWPLGADGRKLFAGTALYTAAGDLVASARATWIVLRAAS